MSPPGDGGMNHNFGHDFNFELWSGMFYAALKTKMKDDLHIKDVEIEADVRGAYKPIINVTLTNGKQLRIILAVVDGDQAQARDADPGV